MEQKKEMNPEKTETSNPVKQKKYKVDKKTAEAEFDRFVEAWDIDNDVTEMNEEDRTDFENHSRKIIRAIRKGLAEVSIEGDVIKYHLYKPVHNTEYLEFKIPTGEAWIAMDKYKEQKSIHKSNAFIASSTKKPVQIFTTMDGRDMKFAQAVAVLFLAS